MSNHKRLQKMMQASEFLEYKTDFSGPIRAGMFFSCRAVRHFLGEVEEFSYIDAMGVDYSLVMEPYSEADQLARQLAVLMYREGVKRGKY